MNDLTTDPLFSIELEALWSEPVPMPVDLSHIWRYAITFDGYAYARDHLGVDCGRLANERGETFAITGVWQGTFEELRCCLFFEQRRYRHFGFEPEGSELEAVMELYRTIRDSWVKGRANNKEG